MSVIKKISPKSSLMMETKTSPKIRFFGFFGGPAAGSGEKKAPPLLAPHAVGVHPRVARRGAALQGLMEVGDRR